MNSFKKSCKSTNTSKASFMKLQISFNFPNISLSYTVTLLSKYNQCSFVSPASIRKRCEFSYNTCVDTREGQCMIHKKKKCQILSHMWHKAKRTTRLSISCCSFHQFIATTHGKLVDAWHFGPVHYQPKRNSYYSGSILIK